MGGQLKEGTTRLREDLKELVEEIGFEELGLVGEKIAPPIQVKVNASSYPVLRKEAVMKAPDIEVGADGTFSRGEWDYDTKSYMTKETGHEEPVKLTEALENSDYIDEDEIAGKRAVEGLKLGNESTVASTLFNETTFAGTALSANPDAALFSAATDSLVTIINEMDDATNATPYKVFDTIYRGIMRKKNALSKKAFSLVLSDDLVSFMIRTNEVMNSVMYTDPVPSMPMERKRQFLADYLEFKEIVPVSSVYDTTGLNSDARIGKFWSNEYAMLAILSNGANSFKERAVARQPIWSKYSPSYILEEYIENNKRNRIYRARQYRGIIVNTDYGILIKNMKTTVDLTTGF